MTKLTLFLEIYLSIHALLLISPWLMRGTWMLHSPALKLKLARLLLVSCILSPIIVHVLTPSEQPLVTHLVSLDGMHDVASKPILKFIKPALDLPSPPLFQKINTDYWQLLWLLVCLGICYKAFRFYRDLITLKALLQSALPYRSSGSLNIKISQQCHIPFSVRWFKEAYIIIPLSLLSSAVHLKLAIAHEGQHHRNRDCSWAYFIEGIRIIFAGNPGVNQWHRVISELQEFSCDETLVGHQNISAHDYGRCLFTVVQTVSQYSKSSERELACAIGMALGSGKNESSLILRRITMLSNYQSNTIKRRLLGLTFAGIAVVVPLCTAYAAMGSLSHQNKDINTSFVKPEIQNIAAAEIAAAVKQYHAKSGAVAVMDPQTGNIIAFAESGRVTGGMSWKSRVFAPASTIKPFVAAAAIDSGVATPSKKYDCHAPYEVDGLIINNYDPGIGSVSVTDAIVKSVNVCLVKVGQDTGSVTLRDKLSKFGFDMNSGWDAHNSDALELAHTTLGFNIPVTLESLAKTYTILANKGQHSSNNAERVISEDTANSINDMLKKAVTEGTGKEAAIPGISVAGKTGTLGDMKGIQGSMALFSGYFPADAPRYVMVVVLEEGYTVKNGKTLTNGGALAAPIFHHIAVKSLKLR